MAEEVLRVLYQQGGHIYVCGGVNMAHGVTLAVQEILCKQLGMTSLQAEDYVTQLKVDLSPPSICRLLHISKHYNHRLQFAGS